MIFDQEIEDWKDLQNLTAQMFNEMGFIAFVEKTIQTVRGTKKIDVYVEDNLSRPPLVYLCECKQWSRRVHKDIVSSFRQVVTDYGANRGYLISNKGFQSGSREAARKSNVCLVTWMELQNLCKTRWLEKMKENISSLVHQIICCITPLQPGSESRKKWLEFPFDADEFMDLFDKHGVFLEIASYVLKEGALEAHLPMKLPKIGRKESIEISSFRQYFDYAIPLGKSVLNDFQSYCRPFLKT